ISSGRTESSERTMTLSVTSAAAAKSSSRLRPQAWNVTSLVTPSSRNSLGRRRAALHVADGWEAADAAAEAGPVRRFHDRVDVLVGGPGLLGEPGIRRRAHVDAVREEPPLEVAAGKLLARLGPAHRPAAPVRGAVERGGAAEHAGEEVGAGLHAPADDHRLAGLGVGGRQ